MAKKIPNKIKKSVRFQAMLALLKIETQESFSNLVVKEFLNSGKIEEVDKQLFTEIVYGVVSRKLTLEYFLSKFVQKKMDTWVEVLLKLSIYQMHYLDRIPTFAILNEAVEIAKGYGNIGVSKFVNGVLRNADRKGLPDFSEIQNQEKKISLQYSIPLWLVKKLVKEYGEETTTLIGESLAIKNKASARVNTSLISVEEAIQQLEKEGIQAEKSLISSSGIVAQSGYLAGSDLFKSGKIIIQDESSQLVAPNLEVFEDAVVLDACAAPGGKTTHIATFLDEKSGGSVCALDIYDHKIELIQENALRQHVSERVQTKILDAREVGETFEAETFDRILVDAPCSGIGLIRRKPDILYHKETKDFESLQKIQLEILESCASTLKVGGILVYSTCTIISEENQKVVQLFLERHKDFALKPIQATGELQTSLKDGMLQILPHYYGSDGFFIAKLQKIEKS